MKNALLITFALAMLVACGGGGGSVPGVTTTTAPTPEDSPASKIELFALTAAQAAGVVVSPPPGVAAVTQLPMSFTEVGQTQYALVYEPGFSGKWNVAVGSCTAGQNVNFATQSATGQQTVLTIIAAAPGECAMLINDGTLANQAEILLDVTTTSGTISITKPNR
jgi:hypothetical protein